MELILIVVQLELFLLKAALESLDREMIFNKIRLQMSICVPGELRPVQNLSGLTLPTTLLKE
jgi:hypothetical protein